VPIHKRRLSAHAGVLALRNPRRSLTTPAVAKSLRPWPEPQYTISGWTLTMTSSGIKQWDAWGVAPVRPGGERVMTLKEGNKEGHAELKVTHVII
jgi:hypothetical protein